MPARPVIGLTLGDMKHILPPVLAAILIAAPLGALWGLNGSSIQDRASSWTKEQYLQHYDQWRQESLNTAGPIECAILLSIFLLIFICLYEPLKRWIARLMGIPLEKSPNQRMQLTGDARESTINSAGAEGDVPPRAAGN